MAGKDIMNPVNFGDTWWQKKNPHPDALSLKDLAGERCIIWEAKVVYHAGWDTWYLLIGESKKDAVWYEDNGQLKSGHGDHVEEELNKGNKPVIATVRKKRLRGLYLE